MGDAEQVYPAMTDAGYQTMGETGYQTMDEAEYQTMANAAEVHQPITDAGQVHHNIVDDEQLHLDGDHVFGELHHENGVYQAAAGSQFHFDSIDRNMRSQPAPLLATSSFPNLPPDIYPAQVPSHLNNNEHWRASLNEVAPGEEGLTPYLHESRFEPVEAIMDPHNQYEIDSESIFNNLEEAINWRSSVNNGAMNPDPTIPRTMEQKKAIVKLLFKAFKSIHYATDNAHIIKPFEDGRHSNPRVECVCWTILEGCIRRSEVGSLLLAYDPAKGKESPRPMTFAQRMNEIVVSMREQKSICKHLLDAPYVNTFVDNPIKARERVQSNRHLNKRKGDAMKVGKEVLGSAQKRPRSSKKDVEEELEDGFDHIYTTSYTESPTATFEAPLGVKYLARGRSGTLNSMNSGPSRYMATPFGASLHQTAYDNPPASFQHQPPIAPLSYMQPPSSSYSLSTPMHRHVSLARPLANPPTRRFSPLAGSVTYRDDDLGHASSQLTGQNNLLVGIGARHGQFSYPTAPTAMQMHASVAPAPRRADLQAKASPKMSPSEKSVSSESEDGADPTWRPTARERR